MELDAWAYLGPPYLVLTWRLLPLKVNELMGDVDFVMTVLICHDRVNLTVLR